MGLRCGVDLILTCTMQAVTGATGSPWRVCPIMEAENLKEADLGGGARPMSGRDAGGNEAQEPGVGTRENRAPEAIRGYVRCDASTDRVIA